MLVYAIRKGDDLIRRHNPLISLAPVIDKFTARDELSLDDIGFKVAFGVIDYESTRELHDEAYV